MLSGFKQFILRGNVVDLAVGVVIGAAFGSVVTALTKDLLTPFIGRLWASPISPRFNSPCMARVFPIGDFINAAVSFLLIAAAVYFFVVLPVNALMARMHKDDPVAAPITKKCPECKMDIPIDARRCGHCTSQVSAAAA